MRITEKILQTKLDGMRAKILAIQQVDAELDAVRAVREAVHDKVAIRVLELEGKLLVGQQEIERLQQQVR